MGLMGICSNCHKQKNNQIYMITQTKMRTRACLIQNPNCETKKQKQKHDKGKTKIQ